MGGRRTATLAAILFAGFIPLLLLVPTLVPTDPSVLSAAGVEGYNTTLAYRAALLWCIAGLGAALAAARGGWLTDGDGLAPLASQGDMPTQAQRWLERGIVAVVIVLALWPPFLVRYGPYIEDSIFATALHRMHGGLVPYRDFEFLYGPLMLVPASWFMDAVGYSLGHYYAYLTGFEVVQYVGLLALLQHLVPERRTRVVVFVILVGLLVNPLLGLNYNGIRRLLPLGALLLLARNPRSTGHAAVAGILLGLSVAYAHDYSLGSAFAAAGLYGILFVRKPSLDLVKLAATFGVVALATWLGVSGALLGADVLSYLGDTRGLVGRFGLGEAGFRFYWTANALAAFGLLSLGIVVAGRGMAERDGLVAWGDRFFLAALLATLVSLKSGLNRSDVWHLSGAFFPVCVAFLLPLPRQVMRWSRTTQQVAVGLVAIVAATHGLGNAPSAAYIAEGWARGARDVRAGLVAQGGCAANAEAPCIENERSHPRADVVAVGTWLAEPAQRGRRVLLYGELWSFGQRLGIYKRDHLNDDFIYDDARGVAVGEWIAEKPDAIVIMTKDWYDRLYAPAGADTIGARARFAPSLVKEAGEWLASVHYRGVVVERPLAELRWRRTVGVRVRQDFRLDRTAGALVVLTRRSVP